jgi:hypothetical protein
MARALAAGSVGGRSKLGLESRAASGLFQAAGLF